MIQPAALKEIESLHLDQHLHPYGVQLLPWKTSGMTCNKGLVRTYEVCKVIANYTPNGRFDFSYLFYRIWNAIKVIFLSDGELKDRTALTVRSDWEKAIHTAAFNDAFFTGELTYEKIIETLNKALDLNWEKGTQTKLEKPEPCRLVLH